MSTSICPRKMFACGDFPMHWCMTCPKRATQPAFAAPPKPLREAEAVALIRRAYRQLTAWQEKYGQHNCQWVPPGGDVRWMEDASEFLKVVEGMDAAIVAALHQAHQKD